MGPILDEALVAELRRDGLQLAAAAGSGGGGLVQYLPPVPRAELLAWLAQASAVLNSSEAEGASCALLEAMAVGGGVVVARRIEGNAALVRHGETGLLFDTPGEALDCCRRVCGLRAEGAAVDARALRAAAAAHIRAEHSPAAEAAAWRSALAAAGVFPAAAAEPPPPPPQADMIQ